MLDEAKVADFERDGFVILPQLLPAELVSRLTAAGDQWLASNIQRNRQTSDGGRYDGFRNCVALDPVFVELLAWPAVMPYMVRLLGPDIQLLTSHLIYQSSAPPEAPRGGRTPGWHRDFAMAMKSLGHARVPRLDIKAAFCLTDLSEPGGGATHFVPGSHRLTVPLHLPPDRDPEGTVEPRLRPGDVVLFENRTWHSAGRNWSGRTRKVVMMGYAYRWIKPVDYRQQPAATVALAQARYGEVGLQLLDALPESEAFQVNPEPPLQRVARERGWLPTPS